MSTEKQGAYFTPYEYQYPLWDTHIIAYGSHSYLGNTHVSDEVKYKNPTLWCLVYPHTNISIPTAILTSSPTDLTLTLPNTHVSSEET